MCDVIGILYTSIKYDVYFLVQKRDDNTVYNDY